MTRIITDPAQIILRKMERLDAQILDLRAELASLGIGVGQRPRGRISAQIIAMAERIATDHGVLPSEVLGRTKPAHIVAARVEAYAAARDAGYTCAQIGRAMGRDPSTVRSMLAGK